MKRGAFGSFVPGKKRKTRTLPEEVADDVVEEVCEIGGEWAAQDEEAAPEEEAAPDEEHAVREEGAEDEEDQDHAGQYQIDGLQQDSAIDDPELVDDEAVQEENAQDGEEAQDEEAEDDDQVAVEEDVMQETEREAEDGDVANQEEALANEGALDSEAAPEGETNLCEVPDAAEAEMDELAKLGEEMELAKMAAAPDSHLDDDDVPAPDYLQDQPDSDSSSSSTDSTSASSGKAAKAISDSSSLLDLLGGGSDLSVGDAAAAPQAQGKEAETSSAAERLERKLVSDLAKLGPKKRAVRVAQLSKWLWDRLEASLLPSGLEEAHEVEALIARIAGEPDAGEPDADIPQPSTPPHRKGKRKTEEVVQRQFSEPSHREPLSEPLWPILSHYPQHSGYSISFAKKKALCKTTPVESFRAEDLWFQNPGQSVCCEWCEDSVPQSFGSLQGAEGRSTSAQCEFVCFTCIQTYGCGE